MSSTSRRAGRRRFTVENLFEDTRPRAVGVSDLVEAKAIRLDRIEADPDQPRRSFDDERLDELTASIKLEGVLQPIAVRYDEERDRYIIVHGERRWRAARLAGLEAIPAIVREVPEERRLVQQLMENVVREDLNALDRAAALRALKARMGDAPWEQVAEAVGIRRSRLFQLLGTEKLPEPVREEIRRGRLSEKQSRVLQGLSPAVQESLGRLIVEEGLGQAEAQRLARAARGDEELERLPRETLVARFRAMREAVQARGSQRAREAAGIEDLIARLTGDWPGDGVEQGPLEGAEVERRVAGLAAALGRLPDAPLERAERRRVEKQLRLLQQLISATLRSGREPAA